MASRSAEKTILADLEKRNLELATEIKNLMFTFDDLSLLDDRSIQRLMREVDTKYLSMSLKAANDNLKEAILRNMSERASQLIKEELEFMGPVRLKDVEESQMKIVDIVRILERGR